jgi:tight adherence protein C
MNMLIATLMGISTAAAAWLIGRNLWSAWREPRADASLPRWLRLCWWPAGWLAPLVQRVCSRQQLQRTRRQLESVELYPAIDADRWLAARIVHALLATGVAWLVGGTSAATLALLAAPIACLFGGAWLRRRQGERERQVTKELPAYLDLLTVCVEAGATLTAAVRLIVAQAPVSPLRSYFDRVLREVRGGRPRAQAFMHVAEQLGIESLTTLASTLAHAEGSGMSLGQILRQQSEQRTAERFVRAEKLAMQAPVKMLGPLIFCIFPCTFIVLAVPIAVKLMEAFSS